jgi:N-acetylglucosamine-6-sulfatase
MPCALHRRNISPNWALRFGKYLNNNPAEAPLGISAYMTNGGGTYYSPQFDTVGVSDLAPYFMADGGWHGNGSDYTTAVVGNMSLSWLKKVIPGAKAGGKPFMAYIAPKACHEPFTPATWYADHWDPAWPAQEPRPISWNCSAESRANHHGNIKTQPMITPKCADYVTLSFKNRWRALMSVDDVIAETVALVESEGLMDNTYFMYRWVYFLSAFSWRSPSQPYSLVVPT